MHHAFGGLALPEPAKEAHSPLGVSPFSEKGGREGRRNG